MCQIHDDWTDDEISWAITNQIIFQIMDLLYWLSFSTVLRSMLSYVSNNCSCSKYFTLWISVLLGAENENILDPIEYQIKSLTRLSQHATQIQGATPTPFMIIDERRIFIIIYNIPYERTQEQIQKVKILLTNLKRIRRRENRDLLLKLTIHAESIEDARNMQFYQALDSPVSSESVDTIEMLSKQ